MKRGDSAVPAWERRATNFIVTAVVLYIGSVAKNTDVRMEGLAQQLKSALITIERVVKKSETVDARSLKNEIRLEELERRLSKMER